MEIVGVVVELVKFISAPITKCWKYHWGVHENMDTLKQRLEELNCRKRDIESKLEMDQLASGELTMLKNVVEHWLEKVEKVNGEINVIKEKVEKVKFFYRAGLGKNVIKKIEEVEELYRSGEFPNGLIISLPKHGDVLPTATTLGGESTFKRKMEEIWASVINDEDTKIGVYGMGGIGKTTALEHINNRILSEEKDRFDNVIWVTVSKDSNIMNLQDKIASKLGLDISKDGDETTRAAKLFERFNTKKRYVLILDDLWETYSLKAVGIPEPTLQNGCKLIVTTRSREVCHGMSCKPIAVEHLLENEALNLFLDIVGHNILCVPSLEAIVKEVVRECAGLPLAVVTIAGSLKGIVGRDEWEVALEELKESTKRSSGIFERLKFSYDRLNDKKLQECLLYCALYPEDHSFHRGQLIEHLIAEGIVEKRRKRQSEIRKGQVMLNKLVNVCLLMNDKIDADDQGSKYVKMHDLVRDMALQITSESPRFLVRTGVGIKSIPEEEDWRDDIAKVSLIQTNITNIPLSFEPPKCPRLSTFLFSRNNLLMSIPDNFFLHMKGLTVLDLPFNDKLKNLPESISDLVLLNALFLRHCHMLTYVPSLAKLRDLRKLDLHSSAVQEVPQGIEMLVKLRYLDFGNACKLRMIPYGIFCKLTNLQYLSLNRYDEAPKVRGKEFDNLKKLESFEGISYDLDNFNACVTSLEQQDLSSYILQLGNFYLILESRRVNRWNVIDEGLNNVCLIVNFDIRESGAASEEYPLLLPKDVELLLLRNSYINASNLCKFTSFKNVSNLSKCRISGCHEIKHVFSYSSKISAVLQSLDELRLLELPNLRGLIKMEMSSGASSSSSLLPPAIFSSLRELSMQDCNKVKKLCIASFPNLEVLHLQTCYQLNISTTFDEDDDDDEDVDGDNDRKETERGTYHHGRINIVTLPKLRKLDLTRLPNLQSLPMVSDSLQEVEIWCCPMLKRITLLDREPCPAPSLQRVWIDEESWQSLEWDHPNAQGVVRSLLEGPNSETMLIVPWTFA